MKKRRTIIKALMALLVILLGANFNAEAQLGGLINKAKNMKQNKEAAKKEEAQQPGIPKPIPGAQTVVLAANDEGVALWNPATLELTMTTTRGGNTNGAVYKIDPNTGKVTDANGNSKGSINNDCTIDSPNAGRITIQHKFNGLYYFFQDNTQVGMYNYDNRVSNSPFGDIKLSDQSVVNTSIIAYVYFGLLRTAKDAQISKLGYDPDRKYTTDELDEMVEWLDQESIDKIVKYESSLPYAGFKGLPEFKNCKIGGVGLMSREWKETKDTDYYSNTVDWYYEMRYWVVYELADGRNMVSFNVAREKSRYGDVINRYQRTKDRFNEVSDWQRK